MDEPVLAKMRVDWATVSQRRTEAGDWSEEDAGEVLEAIKAAIAKGDEEIVSAWASWLSSLATEWAAPAAGINERIRRAIRENKRKERDEQELHDDDSRSARDAAGEH